MGQLGSVISVKLPTQFASFLAGLNFISLPVGQSAPACHW